LLEVEAGVVLQHSAHVAQDSAIGENGFEPQDLQARHTVTHDPDATGIRRDRAAYRAGAASADINRIKKTCLLRSGLNRRERRSGLDGHGHGGPVDRLHSRQSLQRQRHFSLTGCGTPS
jgi:hypothetical protein